MILLTLLATSVMGHMTTSDMCGTWDNMLNAFGDCTVNFCEGEAFARTHYNFRVNLEGENHPALYDSVTTLHSERFCAATSSSTDEAVTSDDNIVMRIMQHGGYVMQTEELGKYADNKPMDIEGQAALLLYPTGFTITLAAGANPMYSWPDGTCQTAVEYLNAECPCGGVWGQGERTLDTLLECDGLNCPGFFKQKAHTHATLHEYNSKSMLVLTAPSTDFSSHQHEKGMGWALERTSNLGCLRPSNYVFDGQAVDQKLDREEEEEVAAPPGTCKDTMDSCSSWAALGYCSQDSMYHRYTILHCPASCQLMDADPDNCAYWGSMGYCNDEMYGQYTNAKCMATCHPQGGCGGKWDERFNTPPPPPPPPPPASNGGSSASKSSGSDDGHGDYDNGYEGDNMPDTTTVPDDYGNGTYSDEEGNWEGQPLATNNGDDGHTLPASERNLFYITGAVVSATLVSSAFYFFCLRKKPELAADPNDYVSIVDEQT